MITLQSLFNWMQNLPILESILFIVFISCICLLVYAQTREDKFDLRWFILDDVTKRPSIYKVGQAIALTVSTWGFVVLVERNLLTEMYFSLYMGIWAGSTALNRFMDAKSTIANGQAFTLKQNAAQPNQQNNQQGAP
jgi:hypothetical protein